MIKRITNISITTGAELALDRVKATVKLSAGDVFALIYVFSYVNRDGTTVAGFKPGYMATAFPFGAPDSDWTIAHLPTGAEFHFMPRFTWRADQLYIVDVVGSLFSIEPQAPHPATTH